MGEKHGFSFIAFLYTDVVICPVDVHNGELGAPAEVINDLGNEGGYIPVLFCPFVYDSVVLYWL